jgi:hypothetical protein
MVPLKALPELLETLVAFDRLAKLRNYSLSPTGGEGRGNVRPGWMGNTVDRMDG